jgi:23S rRNA pseudouridine1911/1915/1917 synthase
MLNEPLRIDKLLAARYPQHSRTYFQWLLEEGFVLVNGKQVKKRVVPEEDDEIEVCFQLTPELSLAPEPIPLDILYEDEFLLAVNKPAGMVVHPAPGHPSGTFVNALLFHCQNIVPDGTLRPGIVHRLDKDTSGVLIAAKTSSTHQALVEQFSSRTVTKTYLAICHGTPRPGILSAPIGRHPSHRKEMAIVPTGKEAITEFQVLAVHKHLSLVRALPKTGRTHQIRVHLKHLGASVLGDTVYGTPDACRHMLHAHKLSFSHPVTHQLLTFTAPLPLDFQQQALAFNYSIA